MEELLNKFKFNTVGILSSHTLSGTEACKLIESMDYNIGEELSDIVGKDVICSLATSTGQIKSHYELEYGENNIFLQQYLARFENKYSVTNFAVDLVIYQTKTFVKYLIINVKEI